MKFLKNKNWGCKNGVFDAYHLRGYFLSLKHNWIHIHQIRSWTEGNLSRMKVRQNPSTIYGYHGKQDGERIRTLLKYPLATDKAMKRSGIMIHLYGAGGVPGSGEIPMELARNQSSDDFPLRMGCRGQIIRKTKIQKPPVFVFWFNKYKRRK